MCSKCKKVKYLSCFSKGKDTSLGVKSKCKECVSKEEEERRRQKGVKEINRYIINGIHYKKCKDCKDLLSIDNFHKIGDNYTTRCRLCHNSFYKQKRLEEKTELMNNNPDLYNQLLENRRHTKIKNGLYSIVKLSEYNSNKAKKHWEVIIASGKNICSKCKEEKLLKNFRPLPASELIKRGYMCYTSHCNECDAKRGKAYKLSKFSSLEGRVSFILSSISRRCKDKKMKTDLDFDFLIDLYRKQNGKCYYSGVSMDFYINSLTLMSVDRLDSNIGYLKDNVVMCCWVINNMKQDLSVSDFIDWCKKVINFKDK